ncbi:MAG: hypothetical protein K6C36_08215, partial [Clostridia bacterium]|nr:hypothetical protein [Clostridia bacterium]
LSLLDYPLGFTGAQEAAGLREKHSAKLDEILKLCAEKEKALEINTYFLRHGGTLCPDVPTLRRFRELGGRLVCVGSSASRLESLGFGLDEAYDAAAEAGFDSVALFTQRTANLVGIGRQACS